MFAAITRWVRSRRTVKTPVPVFASKVVRNARFARVVLGGEMFKIRAETLMTATGPKLESSFYLLLPLKEVERLTAAAGLGYRTSGKSADELVELPYPVDTYEGDPQDVEGSVANHANRLQRRLRHTSARRLWLKQMASGAPTRALDAE